MNIETIAREFKNMGYELLYPHKYQNAKTRVECKNREGYLVTASLTRLKIGRIPAVIGHGNPFTIQNIRHYIKLNGLENYELITEKWRGSRNTMKWRVWRRTEYHYFTSSWTDFRIGRKRPGEKRIHANKSTTKEVLREINDILGQEGFSGWSVSSKSILHYGGNKTPLNFYHRDGYIYSGRLPQLRRFLDGIPVLHYTDVKSSTHNMYILVDQTTPYEMTPNQKYKGITEYYHFICVDHGAFSSIMNNVLKRGSGCQKCKIEAMTGENHFLWNENKTDEERIAERKYKDYQIWRNKVFERDDYTCQCCGIRGVELAAHHKDGYHWCIERRLDVSNGATLCTICHRDFHNMYGKKYNTEEQYDEFIQEFQTYVLEII